MHVKRLAQYPTHCKPPRNASYHYYLALILLSVFQAAPHIHTCFHRIPTTMAQSLTLTQRFVLHKPPRHTSSSFKVMAPLGHHC